MSTALAATPAPSKALHVALWIVQVLLGLLFLMTGGFKSFVSEEEILKVALWPQTTGMGMVRFAGAVELLGGLGLILPSATRILPKLTPLAAAGLVLVMATAAAIHLGRGDELGKVPVTFVFGALAAFVAWGRSRKAVIAPR
jgi:putative oxidoreductase